MRQSVSVLLALCVTGGLFILMNMLITGNRYALHDNRDYSVIDFVRLKTEESVQARNRTLPEKKQLTEKPLPKQQFSQTLVSKQDINLPEPDLQPQGIGDFKVQGSLFLGGFSKTELQTMDDGDVMPLVRIAPQYPRRAALRGIEGWVKVSFVIDKDGSVSSPEVVKASPKKIFDRAALNAIRKWKFKPRLVDGQAVERRAEQTIEFNLAK